MYVYVSNEKLSVSVIVQARDVIFKSSRARKQKQQQKKIFEKYVAYCINSLENENYQKIV